MNKREALNILGLQDGASPEDIKKAYRKAAMQHHPDRGGDEAQFKRAKEAFEYLENPPPEQRGFRGGFGPGGPSINDIFEAMSRGGMHGWHDLNAGPRQTMYMSAINITLREAFEGCSKKLNIAILGGREETIDIMPGVSPEHVIKTVEGTDAQGNQVIIQFRANINTGTAQVVWPLSQAALMGEPPGDVHDHIKVSAITMMLGGFIDYQTLDGGTISLRVPAGMEAGKKLKVKEKGYWRRNGGTHGGRGDVYLTVIPQIQPLDKIPVEQLNELQQAIEGSLNARKV